jgi:hypothetical protein
MRRVEKVIRNCERCGKPFGMLLSQTKGGRGRYCGQTCRYAASRNDRPRINCAVCGTEFLPNLTNWKLGYGYFCSQECYFANKRAKLPSAEKRFWAKVKKTQTCWL